MVWVEICRPVIKAKVIRLQRPDEVRFDSGPSVSVELGLEDNQATRIDIQRERDPRPRTAQGQRVFGSLLLKCAAADSARVGIAVHREDVEPRRDSPKQHGALRYPRKVVRVGARCVHELGEAPEDLNYRKRLTVSGAFPSRAISELVEKVATTIGMEADA